MNKQSFSSNKKIIFFTTVIILGLLVIVIYQKFTLDNGRLHVIFCNVGQGDAIFIRTPKGLDLLVDGGPDDKVLNCLSRHMPFWDRKLEMIILTHPHADHFNGLIPVLKRYTVLSFVSEKLANNSLGFREFSKELEREKSTIRYLYKGESFKTKDNVFFRIVAPTKSFLDLTSPRGEIGKSGEFASLVTLVSFREFNLLLTGDSQVEELKEGIESEYLPKIEVLQVPHHGSKTGLDDEFLGRVRPSLAVISVGKNNRYGHPSPQILEMLQNKKIKILRTDLDGELELISDGTNSIKWVFREGKR